ncbi:MAG: hypothetical protein IV100_34670 [Myxococcales bacterium]|nr:hypothetical protein [Myxococcales bacterium]
MHQRQNINSGLRSTSVGVLGVVLTLACSAPTDAPAGNVRRAATERVNAVTGEAEREATWRRLKEVSDRYYPWAWGAAPDRDADLRARRRFECIWDGLRVAGVDPRPDLNRVADMLEGVLRCDERTKNGRDCLAAAAPPTPFSKEYLRSVKKCDENDPLYR